MSNFEHFNFDCLKIFFKEQEIDFFKNISIGFSLLHSYCSKTDSLRQFIFKLSLKIMRYASTELYSNSLKYFEDFLTTAECKSNAIQKDASLRKNVALKCFMFYNDKIDNVMQKILNAKCVSDVLESYLDYIDLSSGKSIVEIHKIESILSQFLSIEPLIKIKKFYSIWPYFIYISHLKQNNNEIILNISKSLKVFYNFPNFINALTCIKQLIIYLIDDQKNSVEMLEFSDKAIKLEQFLKNKNSLTLNTLGGLLFNDNRLNALNNALELLKTDGCKNIQKSTKHIIPILISSRFEELFSCDQSAMLLVHECNNIIRMEIEINKNGKERDDYKNVNENSLPKFLDLTKSIIRFQSINTDKTNDQSKEIKFEDLKNYIESIFHATYWFKEKPNPLNFCTYITSAVVSYLICISKTYYSDVIEEDDVQISIPKTFDSILDSLTDKIKCFYNDNIITEENSSLNKEIKSIFGNSNKEIEKLNNSLKSLENNYIGKLKNTKRINDETSNSLDKVEELARDYFYCLPILAKASSQWLNIFDTFSDIIQTKIEESKFQKIGKNICRSALSILHFSNAFDHIYKLIANISLYEAIPELQNIKDKLDRLKIDDERIKDFLNKPLIRSQLKKADEYADILDLNENLKEALSNKNSSINNDDLLKMSQIDSIISFSMENNRNFEFSEHLLINKVREGARNFMISDKSEVKKTNAKKSTIKSENSNKGGEKTKSEDINKKTFDTKNEKKKDEKPQKEKGKDSQKDLDYTGIRKRTDDILDLEESKIAQIESNKRPEQWTYTMLKDSKILMNVTLEMVKSVMNTYHDFIEKNNQINQIEWCIFVDNSISVKPKANSILQSLVVLCEVLRRLECKFAVAKFGDPKDREALLKGFDRPLNLALGEQIIESLTFDQGTVPASCLKNICQKLWPKEKKASYQYHIVIAITDGIILQNDATTWREIVENYQLELGFVFLNGPLEKFGEIIKQLSCRSIISNSKDANAALAFDCFDLINDIFKNALEKQKDIIKKDQNSSIVIKCLIPSIVEKQKPLISIHDLKYNLGLDDAIKNGNFKPSSMFTTSSGSRKSIQAIINKDINNRIMIEPNDLTTLLTNLQDYYNQLEKDSELSTQIETCLKSWTTAESILNKEISDYEEVLEDVILPNNKFTRRKADSKGSSLYLPGLIKAIASDFTYTKIFSNRNTGGCRNYSIVFIVDLSYSMHGQIQESTFLSLFCMITALVRMNIENFSIILFAESVKIVKLESQCWDKVAIYTLLSNLLCDDQYGTADVAALRTALNLFNFSANSGPKKIFMFTDGFSSYPSALKSIINEIDERGIELVAISIGCDKFMVQNYYTRYIVCALPYSVHKALRALYEHDDMQESRQDLNWASIRGSLLKGEENDISSILKNRENNEIFKKMISELVKEEENRIADRKGLFMGEDTNCQLLMNIKNCKCKDCMKTIQLKITDIYYNKIAGYNDLDESDNKQVVRDQYGNLIGATYDLCPDYAFKGDNIAVLHFYTGEGFDFSLPKAALEKKGFSLIIWRNSPPPIEEFKQVLDKSSQLWIVSTDSVLLKENYLYEIKLFFEKGKGLFIWG